MLTAQVTGTSNSIVRERYLTVSVVKRNADEARSYFARIGTDLVTHLAQLSSVAQELTLTERLHIFRDFFKAGEQAAAEFNIHEHAKRGQHFKDWFCPDSMEFAADHFKVDARYGRVLYLQDYASYIKDSFVSELCDLDRDLMLSIDKVERRCFHNTGTEIQQQAVFLRNAVKAPSIVAAVFGQVKMRFHPVAAPNARVKVRHHAERLRRSFG